MLEKYGEIWMLELMDVYPTGKGFGTIFLKNVLEREKMNPVDMTICPDNDRARRFYKRVGFTC